MPRYYVPPEDLTGDRAYIRGEEYRHLKNVLRQKTGEELTIFDGAGTEYRGIIMTMDEEKAVARVDKSAWLPRESKLDLWLVQGIPKGEKMEHIIRKNTELGLKGFIPLEADRTIVRLAEHKKGARISRWRRVALEAAKQCGRAYIPVVSEIMTLHDFLGGLPEGRLILAPWEGGGEPLKRILAAQGEKGASARIYILIGPEGGWEDKEIARVAAQGGIPVTLGPRIMRTETAGFAALAAIMYHWGDLGGEA